MFRSMHDPRFDERDNSLGTSSSRRDVIKRIGGFGLVAAAGVALRPATAAAATSYVRSASLSIVETTETAKVDVKITAQVDFTSFDLNRIRQGTAAFQLDCVLWERDTFSDDKIYQFRPKSVSRDLQTVVFGLVNISRSYLDRDPEGVDEVFARLYLKDLSTNREVHRKETNQIERRF